MRRLITTALPYVNNVPHLGNLIQGLSGDVFARYCRLRGYDTLYICGTDEYGTATETRAREEGISPKQLCDRYYDIHDAVYRWFDFSFDIFGRTSHPIHTEITQSIFNAASQNDYIVSHTTEQLYSEKSNMFLADRYVIGTCPKCQYVHARGDQCEQCGSLLDPADLIDVRSAVDGSVPIKKKTRHLYLNLPKLLPQLERWLQQSNAQERWAHNAIQMTRAWMRDGLQERAITRDLSWGIPVPVDEYRKKVFYVWFDAPIGYISITAQLTDQWREWWQNPERTRLYQFVGKDNIPFHTVVFPCSLLATRQEWTMVHHISSTEYLNYEGGQFSKSRGVGVFGTDAIDSGIPADAWRFYLLYNRPENSDYTFVWDDFALRINKELIGNFANFFNRLTSFVHRYYDGRLPNVDASAATDAVATHINECARRMDAAITTITDKLEALEIRDAFRTVLTVSDLGNRLFQQYEPWKNINSAPDDIAFILRFLLLIAKNLSILIAPFLPQTAIKCRDLLAINRDLQWSNIADEVADIHIRQPQVLFKRLEAKEIAQFKKRFSTTDGNAGGNRDGNADNADVASQPAVDVKQQFQQHVRLVTARITSATNHQNADKLFVEQVDDGSGVARQIVSGLAAHYQPHQLIGKTVIIVANLKPIKLRGVMSNGMLLAAQSSDGETIEVLEVDAEPGTPLHLERHIPSPDHRYRIISADRFLNIPIDVANHRVLINGAALTCNEQIVSTTDVAAGTVS